MFCAISGSPVKEPVFSPKSGRIYEKSTVLAYIQQFHKDPHSNEELAAEDLIPVSQGSVPLLLPTTTSIPSLLASMQAEWDAVALEIFLLKKQVQQAREELSVALYHHDAAVRVASKALGERDSYKAALQSLSASIGKGDGISPPPVPDLNAALDGDLTNTQDATPESSTPQTLDAATVSALSEARDTLFALHKAQKPKAPEVTALHTLQDSAHKLSLKQATASALSATNQLLVGSAAGTSVITDLHNPSHDDIKLAYSKCGSVTAAAWVSFQGVLTPVLALGAKVMLGDNPKTAVDLNVGGSPIVALAVHPLLTHLVIMFAETGMWTLHDTATRLYLSAPTTTVLTAGAIHPDGALLASGFINGAVTVSELTTGAVAGTFQVSDSPVLSLLFGVNGYWLFVGTEAGKVWVLDLRKGTTAAVIEAGCGALHSMVTDPSCLVLVTTGSTSTTFHTYTKKAKAWTANVGALQGTKVVVSRVHWETGYPHVVCVGTAGQIVECEFQ